MSDSYKFGFDETHSDSHDQRRESDAALYDKPAHVRNLDFIWPSGERQFFNYAYLVSSKIMQGPEECIALVYTTNTVLLKGERLLKLYLLVREHAIKEITCTDERYNATFSDNEFLVNVIEILQ